MFFRYRDSLKLVLTMGDVFYGQVDIPIMKHPRRT
jgi:hypothetical protein